jgi:hypothetical protein
MTCDERLRRILQGFIAIRKSNGHPRKKCCFKIRSLVYTQCRRSVRRSKAIQQVRQFADYVKRDYVPMSRLKLEPMSKF